MTKEVSCFGMCEDLQSVIISHKFMVKEIIKIYGRINRLNCLSPDHILSPRTGTCYHSSIGMMSSARFWLDFRIPHSAENSLMPGPVCDKFCSRPYRKIFSVCVHYWPACNSFDLLMQGLMC